MVMAEETKVRQHMLFDGSFSRYSEQAGEEETG